MQSSKKTIRPEDASKISKELHHRIIRKFPRRIILANHKDEIWCTDLCVMDTVDKSYKYILTVIDVYTRFAFAVPLKNKKGETIKDSFEMIFDTWNRVPEFLFSDKGTEFYNSTFKDFLKKQNIKLYSTQSELKSSLVERLNKTLKHKMEKVITANNLQNITSSWSEILVDIVYEYNYQDKHTFHKMTPDEACNDNSQEKLKKIWNQKFIESLPPNVESSKFTVGDYVRIYKWKTHFEKGYKSNFTTEIFRVKKILPTNPLTFVIEDDKLEEIQGSFYSDELIHTAFKF